MRAAIVASQSKLDDYDFVLIKNGARRCDKNERYVGCVALWELFSCRSFLQFPINAKNEIFKCYNIMIHSREKYYKRFVHGPHYESRLVSPSFVEGSSS